MKKLSAEKRNQLLLVALVTLGVLVGVYYGLIRAEYASMSRVAGRQAAAEAKLQQVRNIIQNAATVDSRLTNASQDLSLAQDDMASGDLLAWTYDLLRRSATPYKVDIPKIGQPAVSDVDLLPHFPYREFKVSISGTAYYQDLGNFIAHFENSFPHIRLVNLSMEPAPMAAKQSEKLAFKVDLIALIKPTSSPRVK